MPLGPPFRLDDSGWVADRWCELLPLPPDDKAALLAMTDPVARLAAIQDVLRGQGLA
jgi:Lon protease-like protein